MEIGFPIDRAHHNRMAQGEWVAGEPAVRRWLGMSFGIELEGRAVRKITMWRCPRCGLLENYAQ
jgi:hypothetical protein